MRAAGSTAEGLLAWPEEEEGKVEEESARAAELL